METIFNDPREWAGKAVGTWLRFWIMAAALLTFIAYAVYLAASSGWRSALHVAILSAIFQVLILYALRQLYLHPSGQRDRDENAGTF
jgi:hypothetical protein